MLRHLYKLVLLAALSCSAVVSASAQQIDASPKTEIAAVKIETDSKSESTTETGSETEIRTDSGARFKFTPLPAVNFSRVGINPSQTAPLSLNEAIRRALENNNDIEIARNDVRINETTLRSLQGFYDPVFTVSPTFTRDARTGSTASNNFQVNSGFIKNFEVGGGSITPFFNNSRSGGGSFTNDPTISRSSSSFYFSTLGLTYNQPLLRNRAIDNVRRNIKVQRKRLEQSDADFRQRTIETIAQVQRAYWDLVFALRDQQNRMANLNLTKENLRRVEAQITAGAAAPLARAEVATELANRESDVLLAAQSVASAENTLKQLLIKDPTAPEWSTPMVPTDEPSFDSDPVKLDDALAEARKNRPELRRLNLQREINNIDIDYFKNQTKPRVDLNATVSLEGTALSGGGASASTQELPLIVAAANRTSADAYLLSKINELRNLPTINLGNANDIPTVTVATTPGYYTGNFNQSLQNLFRTDAPNYTVGVTIQLPFKNRTAEADLAGARIQQTRLDAQTRGTEQQVISEVRNAVQAVETARQRVLTARVARENAEIQLQGEQKLYEVGRSTTFLLFQRENALANARNSEIRSQTDYSKALAELQRATSTTLTANNIVIE